MSASQSNLPGGPPHSRARKLALVACIMGLAYGCADDGRNPTSVTEPSLGLSAMSMDCDITVPTDQPTIQAAIDAADPGDTICVEPGTYPENITVNKDDLTLLGAQAGVPAGPDAVPAGRGAGESVIEGAPGAPAVRFTRHRTTFDGFTIESGQERGIDARGLDHTIVNNIIQGVPDPTAIQAGILVGNFHNYTVAHNNIRGYRYGMNLDGGLGSAPSTIEGNYVADFTTSGIFLQGSLSNGHTITGNLVENGPTGLVIPQGGHEISANTVRNMSSTALLIFIFNDRVRDLEITGNDLTTSGRGIGIFTSPAGSTHASPNNVAHQNNIFGNGAGAEINAPEMVFDATCNWWGSPTGPFHPERNPTGTGNPVVEHAGTVEFNPWLLLPAPSDCPAEPFQLDPPHKVTGGGQINVPGGRGNFGFNARQQNGDAKGHLNYMNHVTRAHLNCTVDAVVVLTPTTAVFEGKCSSRSDATSYDVVVEDHGEPGRNDRFTITYNGTTDGASTTIRSGNIKIHR